MLKVFLLFVAIVDLFLMKNENKMKENKNRSVSHGEISAECGFEK